MFFLLFFLLCLFVQSSYEPVCSVRDKKLTQLTDYSHIVELSSFLLTQDSDFFLSFQFVNFNVLPKKGLIWKQLLFLFLFAVKKKKKSEQYLFQKVNLMLKKPHEVYQKC